MPPELFNLTGSMLVAAGTATFREPPRLGAAACADAFRGTVPAKARLSASVEEPARNWRRLRLVTENRLSVRFTWLLVPLDYWRARVATPDCRLDAEFVVHISCQIGIAGCNNHPNGPASTKR